MELYLKQLRKRYAQGSRSEKGQILEEFCQTSGYHRKHAIRLLNQSVRKLRPARRGRKSIYDRTLLLEPLKRIWLTANQLCSRRIKAALPLWLPHYQKAYGALEPSVEAALLQMSSSTIDRLLSPLRAKYKPKYGGTKPGSLLKTQIPIKTDQWNSTEPGYVEADTVAHCGGSMTGDFIWSLTLTDIYSGWTELRAVWNKGATGVVTQIHDIEAHLPFRLKGFDSDNGSEFLNYHLMRYFGTQEAKPRVQFTRSRPYHKDDNAHVEQKNWTHVRQLLGYYRLDDPNLIELLNDLYKNEVSQLYNFFLPSFKLLEKTRIHSKLIKKHSVPTTPYERLLKSNAVSEEAKLSLMALYHTLNPFLLKQEIEKKLKRIFHTVDIKVCSKRPAI
jgi:hypothetical protein